MNAAQKSRDNALNAIGLELDKLHFSGRLDFESFKSLFTRALDAAGSERSDLEMFTSVIEDPSWRDWMIHELENARSRRVA